MAKLISTRVLEITQKNGEFNTQLARRSFRNFPGKELDDNVMRVARWLTENGFLYRPSFGVFKLTNKGRTRVS